jgi:RNA polymerase sigma factor (sigma-70 family)
VKPKSTPRAEPERGALDLGALVARLRPRLRIELHRHRIPFQDAEDLVQDVLLAALRRWDAIRSPEGWIVGALRRRCALYWRQRRAARVESVEASLLEELSPPLAPRQEREAARWDLARLTRELEPLQRGALWLRFGEGLRSEEVAARLGYSPKGVRKLAYRCLAKVQRRALAARFIPRT